MRIAYGTDDPTEATQALRARLEEEGHEVIVVAEGADWPDVGRAVGEAVAGGTADLGVVWCWTGTGVVMAATKVAGVRAALCTDAETARGARRWNDANVVGLSLRLTTAAVAEEIVDAFLGTAVDASEQRLVDRLD
jgi:ribose 5-phosphate isomerase B